MSLAERHVRWLLHDVGVNDEDVRELCSEAQLDLRPAVKVQTHTLRKLWNKNDDKSDYHAPHSWKQHK